MNFQNNRYTLRLADSGDNEEIEKIFESEGFSGGISVKYMRSPKPYESFCMDGEYVKIMVICDNENGMLCAVGGAVVRTEYLGGKKEKCAYLTGLKIHPDYRRKIRFIPQAYEFLRGELAGCKCCYTTILDGNTAAAAMLEKGHKGMPEYRYLGHYTTYCFHGGRKILPVEKNNADGFEKLMENHFSRHDLTPADYMSGGFGKRNFYCLRENGEMTACCFIGDQREHKQYKMCSYSGAYRLLSRLPTRIFGYPAFPKANEYINYGTVSYLYVKNNDKRLCRAFLRSAAADAGFSVLLWGGFENNPLCTAMDGIKAVKYGSRMYLAEWEKGADVNGIIGAEAALL